MMCVIRILRNILPILIPTQPKQMTSPRDSNIKVDDYNNNQEDNMRELIATQNQLSQETTQFLANNNGLDPTIQRILKLQSQLLQGLVTQMINMRENFLQRANDNKDDKDAILEGTQANNSFRDKDHASKEHEDQCLKKRERSSTHEEHELEELLALERPKKKKKNISQLQCYNWKEMGHYASECPENKKNQRNKQKAMIPKEKKDISQVMCSKCKELGHYANNCPERMENKLNKSMKDLNLGP